MGFPAAVAFTMFCLALPLVAQGNKPDKPSKPDKPAKTSGKKGAEPAADAKAVKDDPVTAKDPVIVALDKFIAQKKPGKKNPEWRTTLAEPPKQTFAAGRDYVWHLQTNKGALQILLYTDAAPMHVASTIYLTRLGFFDGLTFHRVIKGFMAQGGCPLGNGTGSPGYKMAGEFDDRRKHDKPGILSMANEARPMTEGSQFFLTFVPTPHLDGKHTVFGEVTAGMDTVRALEAAGGSPEADQPTERLVVERAWITVVAKEDGEKKSDAGASKGK